MFLLQEIDPCANRPHLTWPFIDFIDTVENIGAHNRPCARAPCLLCRYASAAGPSCLLHATLNLTAHPLHMPTTIRAHQRVLGYLAPSQVHSSAACFMPLVLQSVAPPSVAILMATSSMAIVGLDVSRDAAACDGSDRDAAARSAAARSTAARSTAARSIPRSLAYCHSLHRCSLHRCSLHRWSVAPSSVALSLAMPPLAIPALAMPPFARLPRALPPRALPPRDRSTVLHLPPSAGTYADI